MSDVTIVGGGIVGCACAYELAKAGAKVTVLEYGKTGMQATNAAAGMLAPGVEAHDANSPMLAFGLRALGGFPAIAAELEPQCGFEIELQLDGILKVAYDDADVETLRARLAWQQEADIPATWLDREMCRELEPRLSERVAVGVFYESQGGVSNQLLALALERAAVAHGAEIRQRTPVTGFTTKAGRVTGIRARDETFACDTIVLAAGARSGQLARHLHAPVPVRPIRGQMIAFGGMRTPVQHVVWGPEGYLVPRANGLVFAGATVEDVGFRRRTTKKGVRRMRLMAARLVPQLGSAQVHFDWAGLRPGTPDDLPLIGPIPGYENAFAATGHYRQGILLGPLTGQLVARGILQDDWSGVPDAFSPGRFL